MTSIRGSLARFFRHNPELVLERRFASVESAQRLLSPLLRDPCAIMELRAVLYRCSNIPTSLARRTDHEVLRQVALLLHHEQPSRTARPNLVSAVHYADQTEQSFDQVKAIRFPTAESADTFLQDVLETDPAGLGAVIEKVKARGTRLPVLDGARRTEPDPQAVRRLATLLYSGEVAVAPAREGDHVFHFFHPRRTAVAPSAPEPEAPKPRRAAVPPPPVAIAEFPPLPAPSGAAPATCACMRDASAAGVPFVAAA